MISVFMYILPCFSDPACLAAKACDGRCPDLKNDATVKIGEGDLMLCGRCDAERHRMWLESRPAAAERPVCSGDDGIIDDGASISVVNEVTKYEGIIVNELLCFVFNRIDVLPNDDLVSIVSHFYDDGEVNSALMILKDIITRFLPKGSRRRLAKRIGKDKKVKSVEDICVLMHDYSSALVDAPAASFPSFVAFKTVTITYS